MLGTARNEVAGSNLRRTALEYFGGDVYPTILVTWTLTLCVHKILWLLPTLENVYVVEGRSRTKVLATASAVPVPTILSFFDGRSITIITRKRMLFSCFTLRSEIAHKIFRMVHRIVPRVRVFSCITWKLELFGIVRCCNSQRTMTNEHSILLLTFAFLGRPLAPKGS